MASDSSATMEWGECWLPAAAVPRELAAEVRRQTGGPVFSWVRRLAVVPWVPRSFAKLTRKSNAHIPSELLDLISLVVSRDNSCRYCYGATRTILRVCGYSDETIDRIERDVHLAEISQPEQVALEFARTVSHANPRVTSAEYAAMQAQGWSREAIAEVAFAASSAVTANRLATMLALPPEPIITALGHPLLRWLRPLAASFLRPAPRPAEAIDFENRGPCARVVGALDGSPFARVLREVIDDALASPVLPRRTKLLMFAVIGRALGCGHSEVEARTGLAAEGLAPADVDRIVANLGAPELLDARDGLLVPFARETVRYNHNLAIQATTRALTAALPYDDVIEATGIAALANGVARLSVLLDAC